MLLGLYTWETNLIETLTKMNATRRNCFCCLVLSYCDRRIWIAVDENGWQSTKLNDNVSKLIDQRRNWTSIDTFQSVRDEIENTFYKIEWRDDENVRENWLIIYSTAHYNSLQKNMLNSYYIALISRWVFNLVLNSFTVADFLTKRGRLFRNLGAAYMNDNFTFENFVSQKCRSASK